MILEVRPGEGGDDAVVFAKQLFEALTAYVKRQGGSVQQTPGDGRTLVATVPELPNLQELVGCHRIQRIPASDSRGRRHTSTATVAVLDEAPEVAVELRDSDICLETYRGSGPGGQHRNKTATAVRLRHLPSGLVVESEDCRSQWQNRQRALRKLQATLEDSSSATVRSKITVSRNEQIASGERPVKEFTWNQQRGEVLDHSRGRRWRMKDALRGQFGSS